MDELREIQIRSKSSRVLMAEEMLIGILFYDRNLENSMSYSVKSGLENV